MSSGYFLCTAVLDTDFVFTLSAVSAAVEFLGAFAIFPAVSLAFSGMQGMVPSGRSGVRRGGPSPINILVMRS